MTVKISRGVSPLGTEHRTNERTFGAPRAKQAGDVFYIVRSVQGGASNVPGDGEPVIWLEMNRPSVYNAPRVASFTLSLFVKHFEPVLKTDVFWEEAMPKENRMPNAKDVDLPEFNNE